MNGWMVARGCQGAADGAVLCLESSVALENAEALAGHLRRDLRRRRRRLEMVGGDFQGVSRGCVVFRVWAGTLQKIYKTDTLEWFLAQIINPDINLI